MLKSLKFYFFVKKNSKNGFWVGQSIEENPKTPNFLNLWSLSLFFLSFLFHFSCAVCERLVCMWRPEKRVAAKEVDRREKRRGGFMAAEKEQLVVVKRFGSRFCRPVSRCFFKFLKTEWWVSLYVSLFGGIAFRFGQFFITIMVPGIWNLFDAHFKNLERKWGRCKKISQFKESSCSLMSPNGRRR